MSIDNQIVNLVLNNAQFNRAAAETTEQMEEMRQAMDLEDSAKSLQNLGKAANQLSFAGLQNGIEATGEKFSALKVVAIGALAEIGSKIANLVTNNGITRLLSSLTVDQISVGNGKYAEKTQGVATIIAATGEEMETVSENLEKLMWFTDETSYNFTDMVSNIGKFTAAGVELEPAVSAMEGIATWAALSGANSAAASRAMYNLSQAMGVGAVKTQDWMSIENAGMATQEFKNSAIEAAVACGSLKAETKMVNGEMKTFYKTTGGAEVTAENFRNTLSEGWFTSDALISVLDRYGGYSGKLEKYISGWEDLTGQELTASKAMEILDNTTKMTEEDMKSYADNLVKAYGATVEEAEELAKLVYDITNSEDELGKKAFKAAQEAKTFEDAINSVKDAASSTWMAIFESIFGNYEVAKKFWTDMANELYDIFVTPVANVALMFDEWDSIGGSSILRRMIVGEEGEGGILNSIVAIQEAIDEGFSSDLDGKNAGGFFSGFDVDRMYAITEAVSNFVDSLAPSEEALERISYISSGFAAALDIAAMGVSKLFDFISPLGMALEYFGGKISDVLVYISGLMIMIRDFLNYKKGLSDMFSVPAQYAGIMKTVIEAIGRVTPVIQKLNTMFSTSASFVAMLFNQFKAQESANGRITAVFLSIKDAVSELWSVIEYALDPIYKAFKNFFILNYHADKTEPGIARFYNTIATALEAAKNVISKAWSVIKPNLLGAIDLLYGLIRNTASTIQKVWTTVQPYILKLKTKVSEIFSNFGELWAKYGPTLGNISKFIGDTISKIAEKFAALKKAITPSAETIFGIFQKIGGVIGKLSPIFKSIGSALIDGLAKGLDVVKNVLSGLDITDIFNILKSVIVSGSAVSITKSLTGMGEGFTNLFTALKDGSAIKNLVQPVKDVVDGVTGIFKGEAAKEDITQSMKNFAIALGILAFAMFLIASIDPTAMANSFAVISSMVIELAGAMAVLLPMLGKQTSSGGGLLGMITGKGKPTSIDKFGSALISFAAAILILAIALRVMDGVDVEKLGSTVTAISVLMAEMTAVMMAMSKFKGKAAPKGLIAFAASIVILVLAVKMIAKLNPQELIQGLIGVVTIVALLGGASVLMNKFGAKVPKGLIGVAIAVLLVVVAVKKLADLPIDKMNQGMLGALAILFALAVAASVMGKVGAKVPLGIIVLAASLMIVVSSVKKLAELDTGKMIQGLIGVVVVLATLVAAGFVMTKIGNPGGMLVGALALVVMAMALAAMVKPLEAVGSMKIGDILKAVIAFGVIIAALVLMTTLTGGGAGLIVASAALLITSFAMIQMAAALALFAVLPVGKIALGILGLAGAMLIFGLVSIVLAVATPTMLLFAKTIKSVGIGVAAFGAGLILMAMGMSMLKTQLEDDGMAVIDFLKKIFTAALSSILGLMNDIIFAIIDGLIGLIKGIDERLPEILTITISILRKLLVALSEIIPDLIEFAMKAISALLTALSEHSEEFVTKGGEIITNFIKGLSAAIPNIINSITELVTNIVTAFEDQVDTFLEIGTNLVLNIISGFANAQIELAAGALQIATDFCNGMAEAFETKGGSLKDAIARLSTAVFEFFIELGPYIIAGLQKGIEEEWNTFVKWFTGRLDEGLLGKAKEVLGIKSPSKEFEAIGAFCVKGLTLGLDSYAGDIYDSSSNIGDSALEGLRSSISGVSDLIDEEIGNAPRITPVLDLSEIQNGSSEISRLLGSSSIGAAYSKAQAISGLLNSTSDSSVAGANGSVVNFTQNNYSPKALSRMEIYRQTRNQVSILKGRVIV